METSSFGYSNPLNNNNNHNNLLNPNSEQHNAGTTIRISSIGNAKLSDGKSSKI